MPETLGLFLDRLDTPIGVMLIVTDAEGNLRATDWDDHEPRMQALFSRYYGKNGFTLEEAPAPSSVTGALRQYFAGEITAIDALPVKTAGTAFQREVWEALRGIPCGTTTSYGKLAAQIGRPAAVRAVGLANGANPVGLVVPCHRVIGSDGSLTGYGGGLHRKSWLLRHESGSGHASDRLF
ncbi:MAG TPA: methylated-DNA--[protein]-cysteine S-methyltransferase [Acidobacteriaceae bacterium]|jgi:methylated-DNA-[protein]-cysteine S-methyltransferase|nr:methylated-DNA--[protein]-cysteine S-methyltransferase [Acidobacteriaceae bacterium]